MILGFPRAKQGLCHTKHGGVGGAHSISSFLSESLSNVNFSSVFVAKESYGVFPCNIFSWSCFIVSILTEISLFQFYAGFAFLTSAVYTAYCFGSLLTAEEQLMNQNTILIMIVVGLAVVIFLIVLYCFQQRNRSPTHTRGRSGNIPRVPVHSHPSSPPSISGIKEH